MLEIVATIILLVFAIIICIATAYKEEVWSYIVFDDEEDYEDYEDDDLDEYYE